MTTETEPGLFYAAKIRRMVSKMTETKLVTWEDVCKADRGFTFVDRFDDGLRFLIKRGGASLCAYVGVPETHPLANHSYELLPVRCHGGLTFAAKGDGKWFPAGFFWYGWDFAHCGDRSCYDDYAEMYAKIGMPIKEGREDVRWTPELVEEDCWLTLSQFRDLMKLTEAVADRAAQKTLHLATSNPDVR